jgi:hypothetical protein
MINVQNEIYLQLSKKAIEHKIFGPLGLLIVISFIFFIGGAYLVTLYADHLLAAGTATDDFLRILSYWIYSWLCFGGLIALCFSASIAVDYAKYKLDQRTLYGK